ncbi:diaphanous like protein [Reticulomyxa filosa]|uniref:Diaphanous like protein n=1 Tax=Reticulomyxa filosa TaxID=46433 RepID=X6NG56_RETFI|nr:diaphanous like protein [Reticulomyxa filosa]|eukprot:ETO24754.1 diaphanous like protein [Reticulomyxa filosa]
MKPTNIFYKYNIGIVPPLFPFVTSTPLLPDPANIQLPMLGSAKTAKAQGPKPRVEMKSLHWDSMSKPTELKNTIWNDINTDNINIVVKHSSESLDEKTTPDAKDNEKKIQIQLNVDELESLFSSAKKQPVGKKKKDDSSGKSEEKTGSEKPQTISLLAELDSKKHYTVCIGLSRLKHTSFAVLRESILNMDEKELNLELLTKLVTFVPSESEQEYYQNWKGDDTRLELADQFFYTLRDIDSLERRLNLWIFKLQFQELFDDYRSKVKILVNAYDAIKTSAPFKQWMSYVLVVGNYMNCGGRKGNAKGFRLSSLFQLNQSKSTDGKQTLLAFMLQQCRTLHPDALTFLKEFEQTLPLAARRGSFYKQIEDLNQLESDIKGLGSKLDEIKKIIKTNEKKNAEDLFVSVMDQFQRSKFPEFQKLEIDFKTIVKSCKELGTYLGEKDMEPLECIKKLDSFRTECQDLIAKFEKKEATERQKKNKEEYERERKAKLKEEREKKKTQAKALPKKALPDSSIPALATQNISKPTEKKKDVNTNLNKMKMSTMGSLAMISSQLQDAYKIEQGTEVNYHLVTMNQIQNRRMRHSVYVANAHQSDEPDKHDIVRGVNANVIPTKPTRYDQKKS